MRGLTKALWGELLLQVRGDGGDGWDHGDLVWVSTRAGALLCHPGSGVLQAVAGDCRPGGRHGSELPWRPLGTAWSMGTHGGEPAKTVVVVPGRLSL